MNKLGWILLLGLASSFTQALEVTQVRAESQAFDPELGESAKIHFSIDEPASVSLNIYDGRDRLVKQVKQEELAAGEHALSWNGMDLKGRVVPPEAYSYSLTAVNAEHNVTHDLTDLTGDEIVNVSDVRWDKETGLIHYHLERPARVSIRIGLKEGGPLLRTLLDWAPRPGGTQAEVWDGWDASNALRVNAHPKLNLAVTAYSLNENILLVGGKPQSVAFAELTEENSRKKVEVRKHNKRMYFHADQPLETRSDFETFLTLGMDAEKDAEGRWVVSGSVPVRLNVAKKDKERLLERRFEPVFYVDGTFAFETEVGFLPMTWHWDTSSVNEGEHYVTVNVRGYEGNFGTATLKFWVKR
ncbi:FlgD immunoglobulin-like domain containing protein [Microbulbifer epialgicus]|uniref:FlgD immunoglobulin-like domain containing protein n=1 Tax=Microbulbifer epialgicus TaxID=393907 RepID=A0ABV4P5S2_9GAMM